MTCRAVLHASVASAILFAPAAALASHMRAGLWEITSHTNMHNMEAMIPPEQLARMKAMGVHMPGDTTDTTRHCISVADAARDAPPPMKDSDCSMSNTVFNAHIFSADVVCNNPRQGPTRGHVQVTFDGNTHYTGQTRFTASDNGRSMDFASSFDGRWIAADCGAEK